MYSKVVRNFNDLIFEQMEKEIGENGYPFTFDSDGCGGEGLNYRDQQLFNSNSEERKYVDTGTEEIREPLEKYILRLLRERVEFDLRTLQILENVFENK